MKSEKEDENIFTVTIKFGIINSCHLRSVGQSPSDVVNTHSYTQKQSHTHARAHTHTHAQTITHTHIHIHIHTYNYTHTRAHTFEFCT